MYGCEATDSESNGQSDSHLISKLLRMELDGMSPSHTKICCPCESPLLTDSMVRCEDPQCHVLQHSRCVHILEESAFQPVPPQFYCEICRIKRADPFWVTVNAVKISTSKLYNGAKPIQNVEKLFRLNKVDTDILQKSEYDIQVWCILLSDNVPFRMHWPQYAILKVNGRTVPTVNRPGSQLLGANGRDDGPLVKACVIEGLNKISLTGCDSRIFCFGVRMVKRRTFQQVLNLILKQQDLEKFEDALARVRHCIGGGAAIECEDSDSDLEVVVESATVNLRCPMSGSRIKIAGRFRSCAHMGCFDLETFVELNQRTRKWQCPICLKNYSLENIIVDPYFNCITTMMQCCEEDVTEIEVKPDGCWRAKNKTECRDLAQWHFPDGIGFVTRDRENIKLEKKSQTKPESVIVRDACSILDKTVNGFRVINKSGGTSILSSASISHEKYDNHSQTFSLMSSSPIFTGRDGEDPSVNQEGQYHFDLSANIGNEHDSASLNFDPTFGVSRSTFVMAGASEIIVLSDSEEENENLICPRTVSQSGVSGKAFVKAGAAAIIVLSDSDEENEKLDL